MNDTARWFLSLPPDQKAEVEREVQEGLRKAFRRFMRGPKPTALIVHPSATQADIDEAIAYYTEDE